MEKTVGRENARIFRELENVLQMLRHVTAIYEFKQAA